MKEIFKGIPEYEGSYEVSNKGRVRSLDRLVPARGGGRTMPKKGKYIKQTTSRCGYIRVWLCKPGEKQRWKSVHRLVMAAFIGDAGIKQVNHKNGVKADNTLKLYLFPCFRPSTLQYHKDGAGHRYIILIGKYLLL